MDGPVMSDDARADGAPELPPDGAGGPAEPAREPDLPPALGVVGTLRWTWRQLTSMRTALILLFLLALAAIPGSVIPQRGVDALKASRWRDQHEKLTPIFERLQLFSVYDSVWFSAIYLLLVVSLVGCILPRLAVYWRAARATPPPAPKRLERLPCAAAYDDGRSVSDVLDEAERVLKGKRYRVVRSEDAVSAERGYLREAGNLLFHLALLIVLAGVAMGSLWGFQGGAIVLVKGGFTNDPSQYDDFVPGGLFDSADLDPFWLQVDDFDIEWIERGRGQGMARKFVSHLTYGRDLADPGTSYDLKVNHPLAIGGTDVFLIGHGYAPVITVTDGNGNVVSSEPTIFLPENRSFLSFGVVKAADARPEQIGLEGFFYPTYLKIDGDPVNVMGDVRNPTLSLLAYTGDLGMDDGSPQSIYVLDKAKLTQLKKPDGKMFRVDLQIGQSIDLPDGAGSVRFDGVERWNKLQISSTPGKRIALGGMVLALLGLIGSLYIRPRRVWVRAIAHEAGSRVSLAVLDRSGNGEPAAELATLLEQLDTGRVEGEEPR
ncbi:MAG: cytochrome c biogenesis protein ResB [Nocardioides sp.]